MTGRAAWRLARSFLWTAAAALLAAGPLLASAEAEAPAAAAASPSAGDAAELERLARQRYLDGDLAGAANLYVEAGRRAAEPERRAQTLVTASWLQHLLERDEEAVGSLTEALAADPDHPVDAARYSAEFADLLAEARRRASASAAVGPSGPPSRVAGGASPVVSESSARLLSTAPESAPRAAAGSATANSPEPASTAGPDRAAGLRAEAVERLRRGDEPGALEVLGEAHRAAPDDLATLRDYAGTLRRSGEPGRAAELLAAGLSRHPGEPGLLLELGLARREEGRAEEAVASLELALALDRGPARETAVEAAAALAGVRSGRGDHSEALEAAGTAVSLGPENAGAWSALGRARLAGGEAGPAVAAFERAARLDPGSPERADELGAAQLASGQVAAAEASFVRALTLDPDYAPAREHLAAARGRLGAGRSAAVSPSAPARRAKPVKPKQIGLKFADLEYEKLRLRGALVKEVAKKSPAARAGLRKGDLVLRVDDYGVESAKDFFAYLKRNPPAGELSLELLREGGTERVRLDLRAR